MEAELAGAPETADMDMEGMDMDHMHIAMPDDSETIEADDTSITPVPQVADDEALVSQVEQQFETCAHCLSHSGLLNSPVAFVSGPDQSSKDPGSVLLPVSKLFASATMPFHSGLPREHAPPVSGAPRHILISVLLI